MREAKFKRDIFQEAELAKAGSANADGKARNFTQYLKYRQESEHLTTEEIVAVANEVKPGICTECGGGGFSQRMENGDMIRVCKNPKCRHEIVV